VARLTLVQVGVFAALWLLIILLVVISMYRRDRGDIGVELRTLASSLAQLMPAQGDAVEAQRIGARFAGITHTNSDPPMRPGEFAYQVWSADGGLLAQSEGAAILPAMPSGEQASGAAPAGWYLQHAWNDEHTIQAAVARRVDYYHRRVRGTVAGLAGLWLAMAVLFATAFWLSFRVVIRPLRELAERTAARSGDDLSPIDESTAFTEVRPLLATLNLKLERIRALLQSERQFFADAAHELRTPLSVIGAQAHVLAHEPVLADRLEALRQIEGGIERGARAVSKLLLLARLESTEGALRARHDLTAIAAAAAGAQRARAIAAHQSLQLDCTGPAWCECDDVQIAVLLDNLIDNALRYCPAAATIEVSVSQEASAVVLRVRDSGPGIAPADRARVFDRFQRLAAADSTGSGLGLAIVQRITTIHGATIELGEGLYARGLGVEIRFNAPSAPSPDMSSHTPAGSGTG
jgi:two-component system, OmpR family, sensor histidine kinase QseC